MDVCGAGVSLLDVKSAEERKTNRCQLLLHRGREGMERKLNHGGMLYDGQEGSVDVTVRAGHSLRPKRLFTESRATI